MTFFDGIYALDALGTGKHGVRSSAPCVWDDDLHDRAIAGNVPVRSARSRELPRADMGIGVVVHGSTVHSQ